MELNNNADLKFRLIEDLSAARSLSSRLLLLLLEFISFILTWTDPEDPLFIKQISIQREVSL